MHQHKSKGEIPNAFFAIEICFTLYELKLIKQKN